MLISDFMVSLSVPSGKCHGLEICDDSLLPDPSSKFTKHDHPVVFDTK
jgi:hypothetical protein